MPFETSDLVPPTERVPERLETEAFVVRPLTLADADIDYAAVTDSGARLHGVFGPDDTWPDGLTEQQNRIDVGWHRKEHQRRDAFTYAVLDPAETVELGCLYVQPTRVEGYDAAVYLWTSATAFTRGLEEAIETALRNWLADEWPLDSLAYPGRDIPWAAWPPAQA